MGIDYKKIGIKAGLSRRKATEIAPDLKNAVEDALKEEERQSRKDKGKEKDTTEGRDIMEIDNTYKSKKK